MYSESTSILHLVVLWSWRRTPVSKSSFKMLIVFVLPKLTYSDGLSWLIKIQKPKHIEFTIMENWEIFIFEKMLPENCLH